MTAAHAPKHAATRPRLTREPLPAPRPSRWRLALTWLRPARTIGSRPRPDGNVVIDSRHRVHLQTIPVQAAPGRPPWADAEPPVYGQKPVADILAAEQARAEAIRVWYSTVPPAPSVLERVLEGLRRIDGGLSPDCGTGCHAPLCPGRHCDCDCHRAAA